MYFYLMALVMTIGPPMIKSTKARCPIRQLLTVLRDFLMRMMPIVAKFPDTLSKAQMTKYTPHQ